MKGKGCSNRVPSINGAAARRQLRSTRDANDPNRSESDISLVTREKQEEGKPRELLAKNMIDKLIRKRR